jgi:hypothetical protein
MPKKTETDARGAPASYPLRIQAIRTKGQNVRFFVYIPMPLAAALGVEGGESVSWELLDRSELHLIRLEAPPAKAKRKANRPATARDAVGKES